MKDDKTAVPLPPVRPPQSPARQHLVHQRKRRSREQDCSRQPSHRGFPATASTAPDPPLQRSASSISPQNHQENPSSASRSYPGSCVDQLTTSAPVLDRYCFTLNFGHCHWRLTPLIQCAITRREQLQQIYSIRTPARHDGRGGRTRARSQQAICFGLTLRSLTRKEVLLRLDEVGTRGVGVARKRDELLIVGPGARPVTSPVGSHGSARKRAIAVRIIAQ